eukprot:518954_1
MAMSVSDITVPKHEYLHILTCYGAGHNGHLCSRLLIRYHSDGRLKYEAHRMALMKLKGGEDVSRHLNQNINKSIRCYVNPQLFLELFEFAVSSPWQVMRDAIVNHGLSIFFNGTNEEEEGLVPIEAYDDMWYKQTLANVHYIFTNIIDAYFDTNDMELVRKVAWQFANCREYFLELSIECEAKNDLMAMFMQYMSTQDYVKRASGRSMIILAPPCKRRRLNGQEHNKIY